ncbi:hypothetical protein DsansV1_C18g0149201 [Dioscorea sansibarensis]
MFTGFSQFLKKIQGGRQSKDAERRSETSTPDPVIPKKNDAKSHARPPMERIQTNKSSTAVATSPSETGEAPVHEESQVQDKAQLNKAQTELHQPDCKPAFPPPPPAGTDQFPNVTEPDTSRRQDNDPNNSNGVVVPPQQNFYQPEHGWDHNVYQDYSRARRDSSNNRRFDHHYYPYPLDQEFCPLPPRAHGDQYQGQDQYFPRNDHTVRGYPQRGDGREYPADGIQNREKRPSSSGEEQSGTLVYDNIVICEDPSKVVIGRRNSAGGKVGGRISGNRVIR